MGGTSRAWPEAMVPKETIASRAWIISGSIAASGMNSTKRWKSPDEDRTRLLWDSVGGLPKGVAARPTGVVQRANQEMELLGIILELHPAALTHGQHPGED